MGSRGWRLRRGVGHDHLVRQDRLPEIETIVRSHRGLHGVALYELVRPQLAGPLLCDDLAGDNPRAEEINRLDLGVRRLGFDPEVDLGSRYVRQQPDLCHHREPVDVPLILVLEDVPGDVLGVPWVRTSGQDQQGGDGSAKRQMA